MENEQDSAGPCCDHCGNTDLSVGPYDHGICPETGYHDCGWGWSCACGAEGDLRDIEIAAGVREAQ